MLPQSPPRLTLRLPATGASVEAARTAVLEFIAPCRLTPRTIFDIELVLEEVLMNIASHGDAGDGASDRHVDLSVESTAHDVRLVIEDDGIAFDPTVAPLQHPPSSLSDAVVGGLGIGLVRRRAKFLAYERRAGRNVLTVVIARG